MKAMLVSEHECANIVKCLAAEYEQVILCSPEKKILENVRKLGIQRFDACYTEKVLFLLLKRSFHFWNGNQLLHISQRNGLKDIVSACSISRLMRQSNRQNARRWGR